MAVTMDSTRIFWSELLRRRYSRILRDLESDLSDCIMYNNSSLYQYLYSTCSQCNSISISKDKTSSSEFGNRKWMITHQRDHLTGCRNIYSVQIAPWSFSWDLWSLNQLLHFRLRRHFTASTGFAVAAITGRRASHLWVFILVPSRN
jgi:hypothetical protein